MEPVSGTVAGTLKTLLFYKGFKEAHEIILNVEGAAELLGVSKYTIYRLISKDKLPTTKVGREWRFHRPTLIQWVAAGSNTTQLERIFKTANLKKK